MIACEVTSCMLRDLLDKFPPYHGPGYNYTKAEVDAWLEKARSLLGEKLPDEHPLIDLANRALALYDEIDLAGPSDSYLLIMAGTLANDLKQLVDSTSGGKTENVKEKESP